MDVVALLNLGRAAVSTAYDEPEKITEAKTRRNDAEPQEPHAEPHGAAEGGDTGK